MGDGACCSQERPHLVPPYDEAPHWVARRVRRRIDGLVAWERTPSDEWAGWRLAGFVHAATLRNQGGAPLHHHDHPGADHVALYEAVTASASPLEEQ